MSSKPPIIVAGPTGVGKTVFAVELAIRLDGEIIGADAYQVYRGLEVLTSQPSEELRAAVPHHLIGFLDPAEPFDAARFATLAREKIADIAGRGKQPILVGGSGLYLKALTHGLADLPDPDAALRAELSSLPAEECRQRLAEADPTAPQYIDMENPRRVVRALEIFLLTGKSAASLRTAWENPEAPGFYGIVLTRGKEDLNHRIDTNVDSMLAHGAIAEVRALKVVGPTAQMAIGLREIQSMLRGEIAAEQGRELIAKATRRYAKRQLTWFRNQFRFPLVDLTGLSHKEAILAAALQSLGVNA